jgi:hypothetical protein
MSPHLVRTLSSSFPRIVGYSPPSDLVLCGDGWFDLLSRGMSEIQSFCDLCSLGSFRTVQVVMEQVEEGNGALRFYYGLKSADEFERETIANLVTSMERASMYFCEVTGSPQARLCRRGHRLKTLCPELASRLGYDPCQPPSPPQVSKAKHSPVIDSPSRSRNYVRPRLSPSGLRPDPLSPPETSP